MGMEHMGNKTQDKHKSDMHSKYVFETSEYCQAETNGVFTWHCFQLKEFQSEFSSKIKKIQIKMVMSCTYADIMSTYKSNVFKIHLFHTKYS